jgi:hypothetical protein
MKRKAWCNSSGQADRRAAALAALCLLLGVISSTSALGIEIEKPPLDEARVPMAAPLAFDNTPVWRRRLETLGREGVPFARFKYGRDGQVFIGITRKGMLGVNVRTR